jgi:hypothetical protein
MRGEDLRERAKMNIERMLGLADLLDSPKDLGVKFSMRWVVTGPDQVGKTTSDTTVCVGGLAVIMYGDADERIISHRAQELLGLTNDQSGRLFFPWDHDLYEPTNHTGLGLYEDITRADAARAIRKTVKEEVAANER